jgi:Ti type entry exclusion protein TrbK
MVMSRLRITVVALFIACAGGVLMCLVRPGTLAGGPVDVAPAGSQAFGDTRQQAKEFFGEKREYDLKGGQEMKPRW